MKKLVCAALGVALIGCVIEDSAGPPTILFDWSVQDCPDLNAAAREAAVVIRGDDADGIAVPEEIVFDCDDGSSGIIDLQDGNWDFAIDIVDQYSDSAVIDPIDCLDPLFGDDCLYYTSVALTVAGVDTFFDYDPDVLVNFAPSFGNFTVDYQIEDLDPGAAQCGGFGPDGGDEFIVTMSFYDGAGEVSDRFVCGSNFVDTRDLPTGFYRPFFDLLDSFGDPINFNPTTLGEISIDSHNENVLLEINFEDLNPQDKPALSTIAVEWKEPERAPFFLPFAAERADLR